MHLQDLCNLCGAQQTRERGGALEALAARRTARAASVGWGLLTSKVSRDAFNDAP